MADEPRRSDEPDFGQERDERSVPWMPVGIGAALVIVVIGALILFSRSDAGPSTGQPHPYSANLKFSDLKLSAATNFVGGDVTYLDGTLSNSGDKAVNGVTVDLTFRNQLNEVVQHETLKVMALSTSGPYPDILDLHSAPIGPGKSRNIRLTLEHISADWNRAAPDINITNVSFQ
jgi:hypothetical protein